MPESGHDHHADACLTVSIIHPLGVPCLALAREAKGVGEQKPCQKSRPRLNRKRIKTDAHFIALRARCVESGTESTLALGTMLMYTKRHRCAPSVLKRFTLSRIIGETMTRTNPNAAIFMMLDVALSDALDDIEESRRVCGGTYY